MPYVILPEKSYQRNKRMPAQHSVNRQGMLLAAVMLASLVLVLGIAVQRFVPEWRPGYLAIVCFLIALETAFISSTVRRERMWMNESMRYLAAEVAVLIALMRIVATLSLGAATLREDAQRWLLYPLSALNDAPFIGCLIVCGLVGLAAARSTRDLLDLAPQEFEGRVAPRDEHLQVHTLASYDRIFALKRINRRFIIGGVLLLAALSLHVANMASITGPSLPVSPFAAAGALVYVITGFLLYSQARLALLEARWTMEQAVVERSVARRWARSSVLLIGGLSLLMVVLPRSYGMGLLETFRTTVSFLGSLLVQAGYIILWLISLATMLPLLLLSWLMPNSDTPPVALPPPPPPPPVVAEESGAPPLLPSLIFWACMIMLVGYALWIVIQRHPGLLDLFKLRGPLAAIRRWLAGTWRETAQWVQYAAETVAKQLARPVRATNSRWPSLRLGQLAPRELMRYFYLSTVQRASKQGFGRKVSQTPYEYSASLARSLPEAHEDISELTKAFVDTHYSRHEPDTHEIRRIRRHWERLRRSIVALARATQSSSDSKKN